MGNPSRSGASVITNSNQGLPNRDIACRRAMTAVVTDPARISRSSRGGIRLITRTFPQEQRELTHLWPVPGRASDAGVIQALDPLRGDGALARLPEMNARADAGAILNLACDLLPGDAMLEALSVAQCIAAIRDLGLVAGSLKRHGVDPIRTLPGLGRVMAAMGRRADMVARDTVYHYTEWNPPGDRRRTYTGDRQERALQDSVRLCLPDLRAAVDHCRELKTIAPADREFAERATGLARHIRRLVRTIDLVRARVSPEFFARELRPYFEAITVGGEVLLGPAAAHIPIGSDRSRALGIGLPRRAIRRVLCRVSSVQPPNVAAALRGMGGEPVVGDPSARGVPIRPATFSSRRRSA